MFYEMTSEEKQEFKERLGSQINLGKLRFMQKLKSKILFFTLLAVAVIAVICIVLSMAYGFGTGAFILLLSPLPITIYFSLIKTVNKGLDDFIGTLSNGKLTYKEYKLYKNLF